MGDDRVRRPRTPWPAEVTRDVDDEIASHLALRQEEYAASGLPPDEAAAAAARRFGDPDRVADACSRIDRGVRDRERRTGMLTDLRQDVAFALRLFRRSPGFAAIAILTLALGIGATTTIFTLANWALLRPVPGVSDPAQVSVFWVGRRNGEQSFSPWRLSYPNLSDALGRLKTISLGAYQGGGSVAVAGGGQGARNIDTQFVTAGYFDVLGVRMQVGRPFTHAEDTPPSPLLGAVISDRLWRSMFHRDPGALQQTLDVAGVRFAILGVAPPDFHGTERLSSTDLWLPGASSPIVRHMPALRYDARDTGGYYELVARLAPGATWPHAQAELESLRGWLREQYPKDNARFVTTAFHLMGPIGPNPFGRDAIIQATIRFSGGAGALLMLIACANVAGLLMIRGIGRRSEIGMRRALGAGRGRLIRQQLAEGLLLWSIGGAAALTLLLTLRQTVDLGAVIGLGGRDAAPPIDWRVLAFSSLASLTVGLAFSIGPALRATRVDPAVALRGAVPTATRRMFVGTSLAVLQLAAAMTLLIGSFLLVGTLRNLASVPLGFDPDGLFLLSLRPGSVGYNAAQSVEYIEEFQRRLARVPGVASTSAAMAAPFAWTMRTRVRRADADPNARSLEVGSLEVLTSGYFATLDIPLVAGRLFTDADLAEARRGTGRAVVMNDRLARRLFGTTDPIGREVTFPVLGREGRYRVVGLVGSLRYSSLVREPEDMIYEAAEAPSATRDVTLLVRASGSARLADEGRRIAAALNPALPLTSVRSMNDAIGRTTRDLDSLARLLGILAGVAALLACVGLYGVIAHGVAQRRREFGIRVALGASPSDVWRLVVRRTATIAGAGVAGGLIGGYVFAQVLSSRLVGVDPLDPRWWSLATISLVAVALAASLRPAMAVSRVEITETLRAL